MENIKWCFRIKNGIKIKNPSNDIANSYTELARSGLKGAEIMLKQKDFLWATVMIYYAEYHALYSFLAKIGIKCENHFCSILLAKFLLGSKKVKTIEKHRKNRIDVQ